MERVEIAELFYDALVGSNDLEQLVRFISARVERILSAANPHTLDEESPPKAIKFSSRPGFRQLAFNFRDRLDMVSGDPTGCISHHH
jgi:hypothetical protein